MSGPSPRKGVTWRLAVAPEVLTEYAGAKLGAYYTDPETMLLTQQRARERFLALYGIEVTRPHVAVPAYIGAAALGAHILYPEDSSPMLEDQGRVVPTAAAAMALAVPDPAADPAFAWMLEVREFIMREAGVQVGIPAGQEGPITTAILLRGQAFLIDLYEAPQAAHHLLDVVTETYLAYVRYARDLSGESGGTVGIADDFAGLISPAMWPEFVLPYWRRIFEQLGPGRRMVHSELLRDQHLKFLAELKIDHFDPGADQFLTGPVIRAQTDIPFTRYFLPVDDLTLITPDRGIPHDNIRAFVDVARQYE